MKDKWSVECVNKAAEEDILLSHGVIPVPAKAGNTGIHIYFKGLWILAFARMTHS